MLNSVNLITTVEPLLKPINVKLCKAYPIFNKSIICYLVHVHSQNVPRYKTAHDIKRPRDIRYPDLRFQGQNVLWDKTSQGENITRDKTSYTTVHINYQVFNNTFYVRKFKIGPIG